MRIKSIKTKIILYFSSVLLLVCAVLGIFSYTTASRSLIDGVDQSLVMIAESSAREVRLEIDNMLTALSELARRESVMSMDWERQKAALTPEIERLGFLNMGIASKDGILRNVDETTTEVGDREYMKRALSGEANASDPDKRYRKRRIEDQVGDVQTRRGICQDHARDQRIRGQDCRIH